MFTCILLKGQIDELTQLRACKLSGKDLPSFVQTLQKSTKVNQNPDELRNIDYTGVTF